MKSKLGPNIYNVLQAVQISEGHRADHLVRRKKHAIIILKILIALYTQAVELPMVSVFNL